MSAEIVEVNQSFVAVAESGYRGTMFEQVLDRFVQLCPEANEQRLALEATANDLLVKYAPNHNFFQSGDNAIGLLLASALQNDANRTAGKTPARLSKEAEVADNFARILFGTFSNLYPHTELKETSQLEPSARLALYRRYENQRLSARVHAWFLQDPELQETRNELNIQPGATAAFETIVLSVANQYDEGIYEHNNAPEGIKSYVSGLISHGRQFMTEKLADTDDEVPNAWVSFIDDSCYICIPELTARLIVEPEQLGYTLTDGQRVNAIKLAQHESVHAWGEVNLVESESTKGGFLGVLLEEYRAELSTNFNFLNNYPDLKTTAKTVWQTTGTDIAELMRESTRDGIVDKVHFYAQLSNGLGLVLAAMLVSLQPRAYLNLQSPKASRTINEQLGEGGHGSLFHQILLRMSPQQGDEYLVRSGITPTEKLREQLAERQSKLSLTY